jgi:ATP-dependent RNA helicase DeaD
MPFAVTNPSLARALDEKSYTEPTPVQAAVSDPAAAGRDMLVSAATGSGKTVAYGLAIAATAIGDAPRFEPARTPVALVVAPTRELALQVHRELVWLYRHTGARVISCVGGMDARREQRALNAGADVVVGTPGRLRDHMERGSLIVTDLRAVVLDEADEMLSLGFREDLLFILESTPETRQSLLFSATIPSDIAALARRFQKNALRIDVVDKNQAHADIEYRAVRIAPNELERGVVNVLRWFEARATIVFCATREAVRKLHGSLLERGFQVVALSGEMTQSERNAALQAVRDGRARVCVATDVAARGLDLPDLGLVVHADLPTDRDVLLHRSGRTGRAGRKGTAVLLVPFTRQRRAEGLLAHAGVEALWSGPPSADEIRRLDQERLLADPILTEEITEEDTGLAAALLAAHSPETIAAALIRLHRAELPAPEDLIDGGKKPERVPYVGDTAGRPEGAVWFRLALGWRENADVRWVLPLICRVAKIPKREVGTIRIGERETLFQVSQAAAGQVAFAASQPNDDEVRIELAGEGPHPLPERRPFVHGAPAGKPKPKAPYKKAGKAGKSGKARG